MPCIMPFCEWVRGYTTGGTEGVSEQGPEVVPGRTAGLNKRAARWEGAELEQ